jgi:hypothetical protein
MDPQRTGHALLGDVGGHADRPRQRRRWETAGAPYLLSQAYRAALVHAPQAPIKALAGQLYRSEATVRRWVQRARDMGLLGSSTPGRAGEGPARVDQRSTTMASGRRVAREPDGQARP